jgi:hypothetical protein
LERFRVHYNTNTANPIVDAQISIGDGALVSFLE